MRTKEENEYFERMRSIRYLDLESPLIYEPVFYSVAYVKAKKSDYYIKHSHSVFEIIISEKKNYKCILNGVDVEILPGEFLMIQQGDVHQDILEKGMEYCALSFLLKSPDSLGNEDRLFRNFCQPETQKAKLPEDSSFYEIYSLLKKEAAVEPGIFAYCILNGLFQVVFWKLIGAFPESSLTPVFFKSAENESFKNMLIECFERNIGSRFSVSDIARALNMSESSLAHKAKDALGVSPAKAFMGYKMKKAVKLLGQSRMTIREIGVALGFEDQFHFSKAFKKCYGKSPSFYR